MGNISREIIWKSPSPSLPSQLNMLSMLKTMVAGGISNDSAHLPPVARRKELVTWGVKRGGGDNANIRLIWPLTHLTIYPSEDSRGSLGSRTQTRGLEFYLQDKTPTKAACILPRWKFLVPGEKTKGYWFTLQWELFAAQWPGDWCCLNAWILQFPHLGNHLCEILTIRTTCESSQVRSFPI